MGGERGDGPAGDGIHAATGRAARVDSRRPGDAGRGLAGGRGDLRERHRHRRRDLRDGGPGLGRWDAAHLPTPASSRSRRSRRRLDRRLGGVGSGGLRRRRRAHRVRRRGRPRPWRRSPAARRDGRASENAGIWTIQTGIFPENEPEPRPPPRLRLPSARRAGKTRTDARPLARRRPAARTPQRRRRPPRAPVTGPLTNPTAPPRRAVRRGAGARRGNASPPPAVRADIRTVVRMFGGESWCCSTHTRSTRSGWRGPSSGAHVLVAEDATRLASLPSPDGRSRPDAHPRRARPGSRSCASGTWRSSLGTTEDAVELRAADAAHGRLVQTRRQGRVVFYRLATDFPNRCWSTACASSIALYRASASRRWTRDGPHRHHGTPAPWAWRRTSVSAPTVTATADHAAQFRDRSGSASSLAVPVVASTAHVRRPARLRACRTSRRRAGSPRSSGTVDLHLRRRGRS